MAGRGSAESRRAARPRWVMMEISRVARASTAERSGSSAGACFQTYSTALAEIHHERRYVRLVFGGVPSAQCMRQ